jgi:hypothetical protein
VFAEATGQPLWRDAFLWVNLLKNSSAARREHRGKNISIYPRGGTETNIWWILCCHVCGRGVDLICFASTWIGEKNNARVFSSWNRVTFASKPSFYDRFVVLSFSSTRRSKLRLGTK